MTKQAQDRAKQRAFKKMLDSTIRNTWDRMRYLLMDVPEGVDIAEDAEADHIVRDVWAMEEEWILDPDLRLECSLIGCTDYDDDEED